MHILTPEQQLNRHEHKTAQRCLVSAIKEHDFEFFRSLVKEHEHIAIGKFEKSSFLHVACEFGSSEMVKILLETGADINLTCEDYDFTPLIVAVVRENLEIIKLLLGFHPNLNNKSRLSRETAFEIAVRAHNTDICYLIADYAKSRN